MPELTPCGDVGMVSAYLQALANEGVATALVVSHLPLVGYLVSELCPGETPPMFTTSAIACVMLDADGKGEFLWQKSPCDLKDGQRHLTAPPEPAVMAAPAVATPRPQSISAVRRHRRTLLVPGETP